MLIRRNVAIAFRRNIFRLWSERSTYYIQFVLQTNTLHDRIDTKVKQTYLDQQVRHLILRCQELFLLELISSWIDLPKG